ncbi:putative protein gar2-like [Cocos nucifera]|nr:putative protein gar2-like [Cocos nucifera]
MAEQMPIITGSSPAEPVDGAAKDDIKNSPTEQAQDKKNGAPEKLKVDSPDSGSTPEKDSSSSKAVKKDEKKKKKGLTKQIKEKHSKKSEEGLEVPNKILDKLECKSDDSASGSESGDDSKSDANSGDDSKSGQSSSKAVKKDEKKKKKGLTKQIKEKHSKKSEEGLEVPNKILDKLECKSDDSASGSESGDDSKSDANSGDDSKSGQGKKKKELQGKTQAETSEGTEKDTSSAASEKTMEVKETNEEMGTIEKIKEKLIGHEKTQGHQEA